MRVLIGVDDSKHSQAAIEFVRTMTWPPGTRVTVVSAVPEVAPVYTEGYVPASPYTHELMEELSRSHQVVVADAEKALRGSGLITDGKVLSGDARTVLVDQARADSADLIVVGSHGRTKLARLLLGSVTSYVVSHAPCSVMVVKVA